MYGITQRRQVSMKRSFHRPATSCSTTSTWLVMMRSRACERAVVVGVLLAVDRGQELEEPVGVAGRGHESRPPRLVRTMSRAASSTVASSAGRTAPTFAGSGRAGRIRTCGWSGRGRPVGEAVDVRAVAPRRILRLQLVDVRRDDTLDVLDHAIDVARDARARRARPRRTTARRGRRPALPRARPSRRSGDPPRRCRAGVPGTGRSSRAAGARRRPVPGASEAPRRRRSASEKSPPAWPATVRWISRSRPSHSHTVCAFATSPEARTRSPKSSSETARPNVRTVDGAFSRAPSIVSSSAPPVAASGFVTLFRPGGRSSAVVSFSAPTRPATPAPTR